MVLILLAASVGCGAYLFKRNRARKLASMTPEQRRLHEAEAKLRAAEKEHKVKVKGAEKELRTATRTREWRINGAEADLAKMHKQWKRKLNSYRGGSGTFAELFVTGWRRRRSRLALRTAL
ncbi:MAG: hypothetical protein M3R38_31205 [Actinomycetota bacterium]|nr:hypothetical protein [Actinomycetota bacterium]